MNEIKRKGELIKKYILSLVYEDEIPDVVNQAINDLVQAAQQNVQADGAWDCPKCKKPNIAVASKCWFCETPRR